MGGVEKVDCPGLSITTPMEHAALPRPLSEGPKEVGQCKVFHLVVGGRSEVWGRVGSLRTRAYLATPGCCRSSSSVRLEIVPCAIGNLEASKCALGDTVRFSRLCMANYYYYFLHLNE